MKKGIIDRIEGDLAVVECNSEMINIPLSKLPKDITTGDVIVFMDNGSVKKDNVETSKRKEKINKLIDELFED
jgi:hypothetical protein